MGDTTFDVQAMKSDLERRRAAAEYWYNRWYTIYLVFGLAAVIFPLVAAACSDNWPFQYSNKIFAGIGGICAAAFGFLKPQEYATGFDLAINILEKARAALDLGLLDAKALNERIAAAEDATTFKYGGTK